MSAPEQAASSAATFEKEFRNTIPRYLCKPGIDVDLTMRHKETNEVQSFAEAFPEQFEQWQTIQSLYDRRSLIYSILDNIMGNDLQLWQVIERFTDDRYAAKALEVATTHTSDNDLRSADFLAALAKMHFVLTNYAEAEANARKAFSLDATNYKAKIVMADIYHANGKIEEAHELYNEILKDRLPQTQEQSLSFARLVGFDGNILPSPFYALDWLQTHPETTMATWNWANDEFYYSPHFRAQFAYYLLKQKEAMQGLVKLFALAQEMPWFKEAVINSWHLIDQLGMAGNMENAAAWLKEVMKNNQWDPNDPGMQRIIV